MIFYDFVGILTENSGKCKKIADFSKKFEKTIAFSDGICYNSTVFYGNEVKSISMGAVYRLCRAPKKCFQIPLENP